jgi:hypothetical protein
MRIMIVSDAGEVWTDMLVDTEWLAQKHKPGNHPSNCVQEAIERVVGIQEED